MPTPEQLSASYTTQVQNAINDANSVLAQWQFRLAEATTADQPPQSTKLNTQYQADAVLFVAQTYVTAYQSLISSLTAGL